MRKVDKFKYPLDAKAITFLSHARDVSPARIKRELRTLRFRCDEVSRNLQTTAPYSWTWVDRQMVPRLRRHVSASVVTVEQLYWVIRCSDPPKHTRWLTLSDVTQMAEKHGYMGNDGRLARP